MKIKLLILFILSLSIGTSKAQQIALGNQYHINPFVLSPAFAGHNANFEMFLDHRSNWGGIDGAPEVSNWNMNGTLMKNMGIGGTITNDNIGIFRNFSASIAYSYKVNFASEHDLRFGLSAGLHEIFIDLEGQTQANGLDPVIQSNTNVDRALFDMSFGINYHYTNWNFGVVVPQLIPASAKVNASNNSIFTLSPHYVVYLNYSYTISRDLSVKPTALIRSSFSGPLSFEIGTLLTYKKYLWFSTSFRKGNTFAFSLGGLPHERISVNYSYELGSGIMSTSNGTHEINVGILFGSGRNTTSSIFNSDRASKSRPYLDWEND